VQDLAGTSAADAIDAYLITGGFPSWSRPGAMAPVGRISYDAA
jgi:hypothetical protein